MQKKQKRSTWVILLCAAALLALVLAGVVAAVRAGLLGQPDRKGAV